MACGRIQEFRAAGGSGQVELKTGRVGVDFDLDDKTRISGGLRVQDFAFKSHNVDAVDRNALGMPLLEIGRAHV